MRVGQWVLYYPDDSDMGRHYQVKIMCWVDRRHAVHVRYPSGHETEVPAYKVRADLACV